MKHPFFRGYGEQQRVLATQSNGNLFSENPSFLLTPTKNKLVSHWRELRKPQMPGPGSEPAGSRVALRSELSAGVPGPGDSEAASPPSCWALPRLFTVTFYSWRVTAF